MKYSHYGFTVFFLFIFSAAVFAQSPNQEAANSPEISKPVIVTPQTIEKNNADAAKPSGAIEESKQKDLTTPLLNLDPVYSTSKQRRGHSKYTALADFSPFDLILPNKIGATFGYNADSDRAYELEYLRGSVSVPFIVEDLGKITDQRFSIMKRNFLGGESFNLSYGLTYFDFSLYLGDDLLSRLSAGVYPGIELIRLQSLGFNFALGNRWTFSQNITFGVDWISWAQPLYVYNKNDGFLDYVSDSNDKENVEDVIDIVSYFPRFALLKLQFGMLF